MASLSSFRKAETRRSFTLGLASGVAGLGLAALAVTAAPVVAQQAAPDGDGAAEAPISAPVADPVTPPQSLSLDDLIPEQAVRDPEVWAAQGVADPVAGAGDVSTDFDPALPAPDLGLIGPDPRLDPGS